MNAFRDEIIQYLKSHLPLDEAELQRAIEVPPSVELGDYAFPCFPLAKTLRKAPQAIATELAAAFQPTALDQGSPCRWAIREFLRRSRGLYSCRPRGHP